MTPLYHGRKSDARWFVRAFALLIIGIPAVAQQANVSAPLTADQVMGRVAEMNEVRAKALQSYSSVRTYHLECHCLSHKKADMVVRTDYQAPNKKTFTIVSESGSGTVRDRVFKKLLEAEQESMQEENQRRTAITPENYTFQISDYQKTNTDEFYVLNAQPRSKNKFLFRGHIGVNAKDFAITRVEGEPAVNPSWWTVKTDFKRSYQKIGDFWLPESNESETKVRVFGTAVLSIEYRDYQITQAAGAVTKDDGSFAFHNVTPGIACQVTITAEGFAEWSSSITVEFGQEKTITDIKLRILTVQRALAPASGPSLLLPGHRYKEIAGSPCRLGYIYL